MFALLLLVAAVAALRGMWSPCGLSMLSTLNPVSERARGHRFSGGEKQRIAIARLLLKQPSIVILDEATAHLDSESEAAVQRALAEALSGRTALVVGSERYGIGKDWYGHGYQRVAVPMLGSGDSLNVSVSA